MSNHLFRASLCLVAFIPLEPAWAAAPDVPSTTPPHLVWQPVQEYFSHAKPGEPPVFEAGTRRVNSFVKYTHLGTDFGFHGPAAFEISWRDDAVRANLRQHPDAWAGMWHSLAGLAREPERLLDFERPLAPWIVNGWQPRITHLKILATGPGTLKLEIQDVDRAVLWSHLEPLPDGDFKQLVFPLPTASLRKAKFLNWTAEPGSDVALCRLMLGFEMPRSDIADYTFLTSYAKLARCYEGGAGLVRDRSHTEPGAFDTIPTTGLFALATAAAASQEPPLVERETARDLVLKLHSTIANLQAPAGILPHFARLRDGHYQIHPGTEFSTVDSAIYFHCLLLAAEMLDLPDLNADVMQRIRAIDFRRLTLPDGSLSHGLKDDGTSVLPHGWSDWGGETALVLLLQRLGQPDSRPQFTIDHPGQPWLGTGFIAELQSLFYPDFDSDQPDLLSQVPWRSARQRHLDEQRAYINQRWRGTLAHEIGIYGLSAGENASGTAYQVSGTHLPRQDLIHPHYFLMSATLREPLTDALRVIENLRRIGFFPPYGLAENLTVTGSSYLPMNGSLNAGFEALAAYHLRCALQNQPNAIFNASRSHPELRRAIRLFYPPATTQTSP